MKIKIEPGKPLMWAERHGNHVFVYWNGKPIYKSYDSGEPSVLFNEEWPNVRIR